MSVNHIITTVGYTKFYVKFRGTELYSKMFEK